jgi:uncharacterized membrane protein
VKRAVTAGSNWRQTLLFGAASGLFCYATFDLTALALLKGWTGLATPVDIAWGALAAATSATIGLLLANLISRQA